MGMQGEHLESFKEQAKEQQQQTEAASKAKLETQPSQQATFWQKRVAARKQDVEWHKSAMEQAAAALGEATIALEAAEESLNNLVVEGEDADAATGETITPESVAAIGRRDLIASHSMRGCIQVRRTSFFSWT